MNVDNDKRYDKKQIVSHSFKSDSTVTLKIKTSQIWTNGSRYPMWDPQGLGNNLQRITQGIW